MKQYDILNGRKTSDGSEYLLTELEACKGCPEEQSKTLIYTADDAIFEGVA